MKFEVNDRVKIVKGDFARTPPKVRKGMIVEVDEEDQEKPYTVVFKVMGTPMTAEFPEDHLEKLEE